MSAGAELLDAMLTEALEIYTLMVEHKFVDGKFGVSVSMTDIGDNRMDWEIDFRTTDVSETACKASLAALLLSFLKQGNKQNVELPSASHEHPN